MNLQNRPWTITESTPGSGVNAHDTIYFQTLPLDFVDIKFPDGTVWKGKVSANSIEGTYQGASYTILYSGETDSLACRIVWPAARRTVFGNLSPKSWIFGLSAALIAGLITGSFTGVSLGLSALLAAVAAVAGLGTASQVGFRGTVSESSWTAVDGSGGPKPPFSSETTDAVATA